MTIITEETNIGPAFLCAKRLRADTNSHPMPTALMAAAHGIETENVDTAAFRIPALNQTAHNNS
jgi:hypothetical protein